MKNNTNIEYRRVGDYNIPNLVLPPEEANIRLGKWGMLHKDYLLKHKKLQFNIMLAQGTAWSYLEYVDNQAKEMYELLVKQMEEKEGITEELKGRDQFKWVGRMMNIESRAREVVCAELIYI